MHLNVSHYVTVAKALKEKKSHRCPTHLSIDSVEKSVEARRWHQINASRGINLILSFGLLLRQVYILYRAVLFRLRLAGYVPNNTSQVLSGCDSVGDNAHDREEKQALFSRSEKLAVCFGRISTKAGVPVYIFKNIRICQGYHCATKVVPTIYMTGKLLSEIAIIFVVSGKVYVLLVIIGDRNCTMLTNAERNNLCNLSFVYIITYLRILS
ncbi:pentatricopeptide repeat-containing protein At3g49710-like isoform X7 [Cornus florida]|uniref:pentatricopeptide repeat-containing protein At3g49710-like isoform X7 n=1 Tax=Cornus florida TaxID=4283 RepID=UPI00289C0AAF|nr:pentatricopeptide repeat-containing protein At3g49710-like isoform X7 [Cornus florida]